MERNKSLKQDLLRTFCDTYSFKDLIQAKTCFTKSSESLLDVILTNKPRYFFYCQSIKTDVSDVHTMVSILIRSHFARLKQIKIQYRSYKNYNEEYYIRDLSNSSLIPNKNKNQELVIDSRNRVFTIGKICH